MNEKTYQAPTMAEALTEVKQDLGRDAVILHTRRFRKGGLLGLGGRRMWEIAAAPHGAAPASAVGRYVAEAPACGATDDSAAALEAMAQHAGSSETERRLSEQMIEIRRMVATLLSRRPGGNTDETPGLLGELRQRLLDEDVQEDIATRLVNKLRLVLTGKELDDPQLVYGKFTDLIAESIETCDPTAAPSPADGARVVALIGPTGVGKTTTVAKLAADFKLRARRRVGLITLDTYRIAAVDQLRTYADIIEVPMRVAITASEVRQARYALRGVDVLLVDTAGRSQNDHLRLGELRNVLAAAEPHEVHLVMSCNANHSGNRRTIERFGPLGADRIILTKLDEAVTFGNILNIACACKAPLSYVTDGQEVPDDIAVADGRQLARQILRGPCNAR